MRHNRSALALLLCLLVAIGNVSAQDLLIRYDFEEESGPALDSGSSPAANGALGPDTLRTTDTPGGASKFALDLSAEGTSAFLNAGDVAKVDTLESFTLTTWIKLEDLNSEQGGSGNVRLLAKQGGGPAFNGFSWNLNGPNAGERTTDNFRTGLFVGGETSFGFAFAPEDVFADEWAFLAVSYDGNETSSNAAFYFGDEENETILLGDEFLTDIGAGPVASTEGEADFGIGFTDAAPDVDFAVFGFQDDVRVYEGVLSLEELEAVRLENLQACFAETNGDVNGDGEVSFADFLVLSENFGRDDDVSHRDGDIDCNGEVSFGDFLILSENFGTSVGAASVPEPSGLTILGALGITLYIVRRRRQ